MIHEKKPILQHPQASKHQCCCWRWLDMYSKII
jgi:hypothetical protein